MTIRPDRLFMMLGWVVFVLGWIGVIYLLVDSGDHQTSVFNVYGGTSQGRVWVAIQSGTPVTIAAGLLWGVGALFHTRQNRGAP